MTILDRILRHLGLVRHSTIKEAIREVSDFVGLNEKPTAAGTWDDTPIGTTLINDPKREPGYYWVLLRDNKPGYKPSPIDVVARAERQAEQRWEIAFWAPFWGERQPSQPVNGRSPTSDQEGFWEVGQPHGTFRLRDNIELWPCEFSLDPTKMRIEVIDVGPLLDSPADEKLRKMYAEEYERRSAYELKAKDALDYLRRMIGKR